MDNQEKILGFLRANGPALPSKLAKYMGMDILLASAMLSDLSSQGKVKISFLKIGGSPLYYLPGQEEQLYHFAAGNLNPKDLVILNTLKEQKVIRESDSDLLTKVSLRSLKDFAVPLKVTAQGQTELFWKWRLLPEREAKDILARMISPATEAVSAPEVVAPVPASLVEKIPETPVNLPEARTVAPITEPAIPAPEKLSEIQQRLPHHLLDPVSPAEPIVKKKALFQKLREKVRRHSEDSFFPDIEDFCRKLKVTIEQKETIRKNAEIDFIAVVPSVVGNMKYFCKAKNKTKCDEKDLSSAYMQAQMKKLPLLFLYSEELSKKAQEMLDSGAFENIIARKVG